MSIADCFGATIGGAFDQFDAAAGVADWIAGKVKEAELPVELHVSTGVTKVKPHFYDRGQDYLNRLEEAKSLIFEACQICQEVLAELP